MRESSRIEIKHIRYLQFPIFSLVFDRQMAGRMMAFYRLHFPK